MHVRARINPSPARGEDHNAPRRTRGDSPPFLGEVSVDHRSQDTFAARGMVALTGDDAEGAAVRGALEPWEVGRLVNLWRRAKKGKARTVANVPPRVDGLRDNHEGLVRCQAVEVDSVESVSSGRRGSKHIRQQSPNARAEGEGATNFPVAISLARDVFTPARRAASIWFRAWRRVRRVSAILCLSERTVKRARKTNRLGIVRSNFASPVALRTSLVMTSGISARLSK